MEESEGKSKLLGCDFYDRFMHPATDPAQDWYYTGIRNRRAPIIEGYVNSEIALHLHLFYGAREGIEGSTELQDQEGCTVFEWPIDFGVVPHGDARGKRASEYVVNRLKKCPHKMERAVLVEVGEFMQLPEGTPGVLPCRKRLLGPDECLACGGDTGNRPFKPVLVASLGFEYRELASVGDGRGAAGMVDDKLPNQVVECGAPIVDDLPNLDSPHAVEGLGVLGAECQRPPVLIVLRRESVGFEFTEGLKGGIKLVELLLCPLKL